MALPNVKAIQPTGVDMFQTGWWTNQPTETAASMAKKLNKGGRDQFKLTCFFAERCYDFDYGRQFCLKMCC